VSKVIKISVKDSLKAAVAEAVNGLGGFGRFVKSGETVFLKPNFNTDDPFPASTDFAFLKTVVELVYAQGVGRVLVGDSVTLKLDTRRVMENLGIFELEKMEPPVEIVNFDEGEWVKKKVPNGRYLKSAHVPKVLDEVDKLIFLPCLKTHRWAQFTGALKLAVGLMKPAERVLLHARYLQEKIAELSSLFDPVLTIMDGRRCFITRGPEAGELAEPGLILASTSRAAVDIEGIKIIQNFPGNALADIKPEELPQINRALELREKERA